MSRWNVWGERVGCAGGDGEKIEGNGISNLKAVDRTTFCVWPVGAGEEVWVLMSEEFGGRWRSERGVVQNCVCEVGTETGQI